MNGMDVTKWSSLVYLGCFVASDMGSNPIFVILSPSMQNLVRRMAVINGDPKSPDRFGNEILRGRELFTVRQDGSRYRIGTE